MTEEQFWSGLGDYQERILNIADRIVVIADGRISKTGTKDEILPELLCEPGSCKFYKGEK